MAVFPSISFSRAFMYPLQRTKSFPTRVQQFLDDTECRWKAHKDQDKFVLTYTDVDGYSLSVLREFWRGHQGASASSFTVNVGTDVYTNMVFDDDEFKATMSKPNRYTVTLNLSKRV